MAKRTIRVFIPNFIPKYGTADDAQSLTKELIPKLKNIGFLTKEAFMWKANHYILYAEGLGKLKNVRDLLKDYPTSLVTFHIGTPENVSSP